MAASGTGTDKTSALPVYDESEWPLLRVTMPRAVLSDEAFKDHLDACSQRYTRRQPFCMLIDMGEHPPLGAVRRKAVADRMMLDSRRFPRIMLGCALVVRTPVSRGGVTAINWIATPEYSFAAFGDMGHARKWLAELLQRNGVAPPGPGPGDPSPADPARQDNSD